MAANVDLTPAQALERARAALQAAQLTLHDPLPTAIGGTNEWVWAVIAWGPAEKGTQILVHVASNPSKRGESFSTCAFLMEFMKTGKAPVGTGVATSVVGEWEWKWEGYTGRGTTKLMLRSDGKVPAPEAGWMQGEWWAEGDKVFVYWPTSFPKTNLHYVMVFTLSPDGRTMATTKGNYYYKSVTATRTGKTEPTTAGPAATTSGTASGPIQPDRSWGKIVSTLKPQVLPKAPLAMPPTGADHAWLKSRAPVGADEPSLALSEESNPQAAVLRGATATYEPDRDLPDKIPGRFNLSIQVDRMKRGSFVDVYVNGYLRTDPSDKGFPNVGIVPAYRVMRVPFEAFQAGVARVRVDVPKVLPAIARVELYESLGDARPDLLLGQTNVTLDQPNWPDYQVMPGQFYLFAEEDKRETGPFSRIAVAFSHPGIKFYVSIPQLGKRTDHWFSFSTVLKDSENSIVRELTRRAKYPGSPDWANMVIGIFPSTSVLDRDHRNNVVWPNQPNLGYLDGPPIRD